MFHVKLNLKEFWSLMPFGYTGIGKITITGNSTGKFMFHGKKYTGNMKRNTTRILGNNVENMA